MGELLGGGEALRVDHIEISAFLKGKQFFRRFNGLILIDLPAFYLQQSFHNILHNYELTCFFAVVIVYRSASKRKVPFASTTC